MNRSKKEKKMNRSKKEKQRNQGMVTLPFLLVLVILLFFLLSFLFLSMTLSHISVTQYMSYSTARKFFLSGENSEDQSNKAKQHYTKLRKKFFKGSAYTGGPGDWFKIPENFEETGDDNKATLGLLKVEDGELYPEENKDRNRFYGASILFITYVVKLKIPFLSSVNDKPLEARVSSFLGRESSKQECLKFHEDKAKKIKEFCQGNCPEIKDSVLVSREYRGDNGC